MIPIGDVIPTRTPPVATVALIALTVIFSTLVIRYGFTIVLFNMLFLWLFGWTVEDRFGHARFATLYLACGTVVLLLSWPLAAISSAVGCIIGAYFALYPRSSMLVLIPLPLMAVEIPAAVFLGLWCVLQILTGAFAAPFVSFFVGGALCLLLRRPERIKVDWWSP
jgi:membrane associated rhomboid family serine protease